MRLFLLLALFAAPLAACLWDYDTLAQESAGMPDVKAVIVGGFPRNPPLYYEMRLERVTKLLAQNPDDLDAYDAAGVACDRLGRANEAIAWMEKKQAAMQRMGYDTNKHEQPNHSYRHKANLGTFYAHRWFGNGAKRYAMDDLKRGRELIAEAIKEYPNAHFGREKYQLMVMDWVINGPSKEMDATGSKWDTWTPVGSANFMKIEGLRPEDLEPALKGLVGLVTMGTAWESIDVMNAIRAVLSAMQHAAFSYFAELRVRELIDAGKRGLFWPNTLVPKEAAKALSTPAVTDTASIRAEYRTLRKLADEWSNARTNYLQAAMKDGLHPDTHPDFWAGFEGSPDQMVIPEQGRIAGWVDSTVSWWRRYDIPILFIGGLGVAAICFVSLPFVVLWRRRRSVRRGKPKGVSSLP